MRVKTWERKSGVVYWRMVQVHKIWGDGTRARSRTGKTHKIIPIRRWRYRCSGWESFQLPERDIPKKKTVSLVSLWYQGETSDNILGGCVSHDTALAASGRLLSEKSRPKDNGEVLHRHRVVCRMLVYAKKKQVKAYPSQEYGSPRLTDAGDPWSISVWHNWDQEARWPVHVAGYVVVYHFQFLDK